MLKKAGFVVAAAAAGFVMLGGTASAAPAHMGSQDSDKGYVSFEDAYHQFIEGGGALGYGAASVVAGAYAGIATTPAEILESLNHVGN